MKQVYIVSTHGFRKPVVFADRERAEAVAAMCGATVEAVSVIDVDAPWMDECSEGGNDDGRA